MAQRSLLAARTALLAAVTLLGVAVPLEIERSVEGVWIAVKEALADKGSDDRGGDRGRSDDRGESDDRRGGDERGRDDRSGGSVGEDRDAEGRGQSDRSGRRDRDDEDDDLSDREPTDRNRRNGRSAAQIQEQRSRGERPEAVVELSDEDLARVLRGERTLVDDRGRVLEVEIEVEDGRRTVSVKPDGGDAQRNPGPIGAVEAVDSRGKVVREVEIDRAARAANVKPGADGQRGGRAVLRHLDDNDLGQIGDDLSPGEEEALIRGGWR